MKIVIIGGGSAGTTCAFELRKLNKDIEITILEESSYNEYSPCALPYVISGEIANLSDIFIFREKDYQENKIEICLNSKATDIDKKKKIVYYSKDGENKSINYDYLILASGSTAFIPPIKGLENVRYSTLKTIDDANKILKSIKKGSTSVIIGGGLIGVELAISLSQKKEKVKIIEGKEYIFSSILDKDMVNELKIVLENNKIDVHENIAITEINSNKVIFKEGEISYDNLYVCTGIRANTTLAKKIGIDIDKGIIVNDLLQTSIKNIYACGDCVESIELNSSEKILSQLGTTAVRQAKIIATNITSESKTKFAPVLNNTITKISNVYVASVGLTMSRCKELEIPAISSKYTSKVRSEYYPSKSKITIKIICNTKGKIIGGQIIGNKEVVGRINLIAFAIQKNSHISELAELETCYNPASAPIFDPLTITAGISIKKLYLLKQRN